ALRLDPVRALAAADLVGGGRAVTFRSRGTVCYRVGVDPAQEHSRSYLLAAVSDWARGRAHTSVDGVGDLVGFTACDPGAGAAAPPKQQFQDVEALVGFRAGIVVSASKGQGSVAFAQCIARVAVQLPGA